MKKRIFTSLLVLLMLAFITISAYAAYSTSSNDSTYTEAVNRITSLGIMHGDENLIFNKDYNISREQYIKAVVMISGLEESAEQLKGKVTFSDVSSGRWSNGYINAALKEGFITGKAGDGLKPLENITFAEACTIGVKSLGYKELAGNEPWNYIQKARELGLAKDLNLRSSDELTGWDAAVILDRIFMTRIKQNNPKYLASMEDYLWELVTEVLVINDSEASEELVDGQVMSDLGILNIIDPSIKLEVGKKYRVGIYGDIIIRSYEELDTVKGVTIKSSVGNRITYYENDNLKSMVLPEKTVYLYDGSEVSYNQIVNYLKVNSVIIFEYNYDKSEYECAYIIDPVYSKAEVAVNYKAATQKIGEIDLSEKAPIIKGGRIITAQQINEKDLVYKVTDIWSNHKYFLVLDSRAEGEITDISPNKLSPQVIQIDGKDYTLNDQMDFAKINESSGSFKVGDRVSALIGYDETVIDLFPLVYKSGPYSECIVLGNSETQENLMENQVLTDKGILFKVDGIDMELGNKYEVVIDGNTIVRVGKNLNLTENISVDRTLGNYIYYTKNDEVKTAALPGGISYYYNGGTQSVENIKSNLQVGSSIILGLNDSKTGYEYGVLLDPVYSGPEVPYNFQYTSQQLGNIDLSMGLPIVKNGDLINAYEIYNMNVVYEIHDVWGENKYVLVLDDQVGGIIKSYWPNKLSPQSITISSGRSDATYEFSKDMNFDKLYSTPGTYRVGSSVILILGRDGKVVDIN